MADIFLVRHGETAWNRELRFQGQIDVPLNDLGLTQAQRLADRLRQEWKGGFDKPLHLVSSDLQRAHQTATTLGQALHLPVTAHAPLREQHRADECARGLVHAALCAQLPPCFVRAGDQPLLA